MAETSLKTPEKTLTSKINCCHALQTNNVQAMLLQSERVSEIHLSANWKPIYRDRTKQAVKELNLCGKRAVDKSAQVKACHKSKVKLPYDCV